MATYCKKYVALNFTDTTSRMLRMWCIANGFDLTVKFNGDTIDPNQFDFHTTIFFSDTVHTTKPGTMTIKPFEVKVKGFDMLGVEKNVPVMLVDLDNTPELRTYRDFFERQGYKDSWPEYKPHISLSYAKDRTSLEGVELPMFQIIANTIQIEDQKN